LKRSDTPEEHRHRRCRRDRVGRPTEDATDEARVLDLKMVRIAALRIDALSHALLCSDAETLLEKVRHSPPALNALPRASSGDDIL